MTRLVLRLAAAHPWLWHLLARLGILGPVLWRHMTSDPQFHADMAEAKADLEAGRFYRWNGDGTTTPNPDWPKDGPQPTHP